MTTSTWHFMNAQGEQVGPVTRIALMQLYRLKQLGPSTRVFAEHLDGWQQYDAVPELGDVAAGSTSRHVLAPAESEHVTTEWDTSRGMRLLGEAGAVHCTISVDGEVRDGNDVAVAYIEENGSVGNARMEYLGEVSHAGHVLNQQGELVGEFDGGRGYVRDAAGSVIAEMNKSGNVKGNAGKTAGCIEGFEYDRIRHVAAYLLLVDNCRFVAGS